MAPKGGQVLVESLATLNGFSGRRGPNACCRTLAGVRARFGGLRRVSAAGWLGATAPYPHARKGGYQGCGCDSGSLGWLASATILRRLLAREVARL